MNIYEPCHIMECNIPPGKDRWRSPPLPLVLIVLVGLMAAYPNPPNLGAAYYAIYFHHGVFFSGFLNVAQLVCFFSVFAGESSR